ncbi:hypothetical protein [Streptomyces chartreusis]
MSLTTPDGKSEWRIARLIVRRVRNLAKPAVVGEQGERARELGFYESDVLRCVISPEQTYGGAARHPKGRRTYQRRDSAYIIDTAHCIAVTVLLRHDEPWRHGTHTRRTMPSRTGRFLRRTVRRDHRMS